jgi:hypothetical protein
MLLDEKFFNAIFYSEWKFKEKHIVPNCVYVADEFAIGFAEWLPNNAYKESKCWRMYDKKDNDYSTEELLEIYKKDEGL